MLGVAVAACQGDGGTLAPDNSPVTFGVSNSLIAPITISIDGVRYALLAGGGATTSLTVPAHAQLTWTSAKPKDANGEIIPDDIGDVSLYVAGINRTLEIANVIADQPYFTARIHNATSIAVSIGVFDGASVACAGALPAAANGVNGFVQIGYYRLRPTTELRAYLDAAHCTGAYVVWPSSALADFAPKSGLISLILETAP